MSDAAYIGRSDLDQGEIVKQINLFLSAAQNVKLRKLGARVRRAKGWDEMTNALSVYC